MLPSHASVVVIGGGVMGCSTLYHLSKFGVSDAILLERNQLTSGTTWHSAAQVRALRSTRNLTDLIRYSVDLYGSLEQETGQQTGWINKGSLSIATNPERLTHIRRQEALANLFGVNAESISPGEAGERWPLMNTKDVVGAVWSPDDGRVSPSDLCAALAKGAKSRGAQIFENTAVTGIITEGNRIKGVETTAGPVRCDAVALCSGLWSRENAAMAGVSIPVWPCEHFYLLTRPIAGISGNLPTLSDHDSHLYIRDDSGGLLVGCFEPMGKPIDPAVIGTDFAFQLLEEDWDHFEPMMMNALHRLPALAEAEVKTLLNGPESFTPDGSFLLGESAETDGFFLGCGMNSVGVATGGGAGMALARCIVEGAMPMDLHEADPARYPDCFSSVSALSERVPEVLGKHYEITFPGRQWETSRNLRKTPLHHEWTEAGAWFGQVFGWERPMYFNSSRTPVLTFGRSEWFDQVGNEVRYAHENAAIFDQSTFGKIRVTGRDAEVFLDRVCANDMTRSPGRVIYTPMLNERGGYESDLTVMRISDEEYMLYVGTAAVRRDLAWLRRSMLTGERVELEDVTDQLAVLGLMGPRSGEIAEGMGLTAITDLGFFCHGVFDYSGAQVRAARLSYVGEPGWEISMPAGEAPAFYQAATNLGAKPAGMFAQTSMRIEKGFQSYGHDLDTDINPIQAGLDFAVAWNSSFTGKEALMALRDSQPESEIVTIILDDKEIEPIGNEPVYLDGKIIGKTTSAAFGYRVGRPIALAHVAITAGAGINGCSVEVDIARNRVSGTVKTGPAWP